MSPADAPLPWLGIAVAGGAGLLIGVERERRKLQPGHTAFAGVRTFTVAALAGAIAQTLALPWLVLAGALLIGALIVIAYQRSSQVDPGITTELALFVTYLIGVTAAVSPALAAGVAVGVTALLAARPRLHAFAREILSADELRDALILAGAVLIVLPLMPPASIGWMGGIDLRTLWGVVVLLLALQAAGHVALRALGARHGLALSGLASGFVTSSGTIAALGLRARKDPALLAACASGALLSCVATFVQLALLILALRPAALPLCAPALAGALAMVVATCVPALLRSRGGAADELLDRRAFSLPGTIGFAMLLVAVTLATGWVQQWMGSGAVLAATALAGFADVHAASASTLSLANSGAVSNESLPLLMLAAITSNSVTKIVATATGGPRYALRVAPGVAAIAAAAWGGAWIAGTL
jgi:uncharacterized membrane protein (DUF4010 family)